jgi:hypothetical protein
LVVVIVAGAVLVGCSGSDGSDSPDGSTPDSTTSSPAVLGRIDGPAQVDPSFDPMQVDPTTPGTESGG